MDDLLIIGGSGVLGDELSKRFSQYNKVLTYKNSVLNKKNSFFLDIRDKGSVKDVIEKINPSTIIHTAAITDLDWCEVNKEKTFHVNVIGTKNIIEFAKKSDSKLIFISTDSVFDGVKGNYNENDIVNPINVYSESKVIAENLVKEYKKSTIIRTTFFGTGLGSKKETFISYLFNEIKNNRNVRVPSDKISNGVCVSEFSKIVEKIHQRELTGILHVGSKDYENNFNFASRLVRNCNYDEKLIQECKFDEIFRVKKLKAKRALNTTLNIEKISRYIEMPNLVNIVNLFKQNILENQVNIVRD